MNEQRDNAEKICKQNLAAIEADKRGEDVESQELGGGDWIINNNPLWLFGIVNYRPKPKPRIWWLVPDSVSTSVMGSLGAAKNQCHSRQIEYNRIVEVKEVLK